MTAAGTETPVVALFGSPNSGKTSLYNAITGGREKIANYPGVTIERVSKEARIGGAAVEVVDIPGLYSLKPISDDEAVARDSLFGESRPSLLVFVIDAVNLERSLFLLSQAAEARIPIVCALTMSDLAKREGAMVDADTLAERIGCPVVPVLASSGKGLEELKGAIGERLAGGEPLQVPLGYPPLVVEAVRRLADRPDAPVGTDGEVRALLLSDPYDGEAEEEAPDAWTTALRQEQEELLGAGIQGRTLDAQTRYAWAGSIRREVVFTSGQAKRNVTDAIDRVLTHRFFGLLIFLGLMYLVFQSIYTLAGPFMDFIDTGFGALSDWVSPMLAGNEIVQSLVVDGIIAGVGSAVIFLPQILILFFFIAVLEGSGYLARASFLMDKALGWTGLNGRAFIPLLSSFACAIPGVMAARIMPDPKARLATILVAPLMSCSARLPVYVLMIGAFVEPKFGPWIAGAALFLMHFVGLIVAVPVALVLNRGILKGKRLPFALELPRYQWPRPKDIGRTLFQRGKIFMATAGKIIFVLSIVIWALLYFPRSEAKNAEYQAAYASLTVERQSEVSEDQYLAERQRADSFLGMFGRTLEPVFAPAGFDWRLTTAILAAFPAREVVVPAMGILFSVGDGADEESADLRSAMANATWPDGRPLITIWTAFSLMVFFALCAQCMATLAAVKRETGSWKWALVSFSYMTILAYLAALGIEQFGRMVSG